MMQALTDEEIAAMPRATVLDGRELIKVAHRLGPKAAGRLPAQVVQNLVAQMTAWADALDGDQSRGDVK